MIVGKQAACLKCDGCDAASYPADGPVVERPAGWTWIRLPLHPSRLPNGHPPEGMAEPGSGLAFFMFCPKCSGGVSVQQGGLTGATR